MKQIILIFILFTTSINAKNNGFTIEDCKNQLNINNIDNDYLNKIYNEVKNNSIQSNCKNIYLNDLREKKLTKIKEYNKSRKEKGYKYVELPKNSYIQYADESKKMIDLFYILDKEKIEYNKVDKKFLNYIKEDKNNFEYELIQSQINNIEDSIHVFLAENNLLTNYKDNNISFENLKNFPIQMIRLKINKEVVVYEIESISSKSTEFYISYRTKDKPSQHSYHFTISGDFFSKKYNEDYFSIIISESTNGTYMFKKTKNKDQYYIYRKKRK